MKYRKRPVVVEAYRWRQNGDHPGDVIERRLLPGGIFPEGKVVRYFRRPGVPGARGCKHCNRRMDAHGWIDTPEGGHIVCPGDYVITGVKGEHYPCKPDVFEATYESAEEPPAA